MEKKILSYKDNCVYLRTQIETLHYQNNKPLT